MSVIRRGEGDIVVKSSDLKSNKRQWSGYRKRSTGPSKRSAQSGYKYESEVLKSLELLKVKHPQLWYYKMVDTYSYDWIKSILRELGVIITELNSLSYVRKRYYNELSRIKQILETIQKFVVPKVPADIIVFYNGRAVVIECKSSQRAGGFVPFAPYVSDHQLETSKEIEKSGIPYLFFVCDKSVSRHDTMSIFTTRQFDDMKLWCDKENRRTTPWTKVQYFAGVNLPKEKGQVFDLEWLIKYMEKLR
jgi:penicillin-binding protein-related factor A (putative recombinase)